MRPYTHIGQFPKTLKRFATYLQSQRISYRLYSDYDGEFVMPVNSRYYFGVMNGVLTRITRGENLEKQSFDFMPIREDIL